MSRQRLAVGLAALAAAMCVTAMLLYPGGTPLDRAASGYSLTQNFLSDLGMTTSYGGGSNRGGATLFVFSILALVADSVVSLRPFVRACSAFASLAPGRPPRRRAYCSPAWRSREWRSRPRTAR